VSRKVIAIIAVLLAGGCVINREQNIPRLATQHVQEGNDLFKQGRVRGAIAEYLRATEIAPAYGEAHYDLGQAYEKAAEYDNALLAYRRAAEIDRYDPAIWNRIGSVYLEMGQFPSAEQALIKALLLCAPELGRGTPTAEMHNNLGLTYSGMGKYASAAEHHQTAAELAPDDARIFNNLAVALTKRQDFDRAAQAYQDALKLAPDYLDAHYNAAKFYVEYNRNDAKALFHCKRYQELGGAAPQVQKWMEAIIGRAEEKAKAKPEEEKTEE